MLHLPPDELRKGLDSDIASGTDIYHLALPHFFAFRSKEIRAGDIAHMGEVARLRSIPCYRKRCALPPLFEEFADDERIVSLRIEPWTVHIEVTQADRLKAIDFLPYPRVELTDMLLEAVGTQGVQCHIFTKRHLCLVAIGGARCGINDALYLAVPRGHQHHERAHNVCLGGFNGVLNRELDARPRGGVKDVSRTSDDRGDCVPVPHVGIVENCLLVDIRLLARRQVIDDMRLVAACNAQVDDVRADKPRTSRYDHLVTSRVLL